MMLGASVVNCEQVDIANFRSEDEMSGTYLGGNACNGITICHKPGT